MMNFKSFTSFCYNESETNKTSEKEKAETIRKKKQKLNDKRIELIKKKYSRFVNSPSEYE